MLNTLVSCTPPAIEKVDKSKYFSYNASMSGHSKWSQIKRQKGTADVKKGQLFGKLGNAITIAAQSGADPSINIRLRSAIENARKVNMPKENIERAIARATKSNASR